MKARRRAVGWWTAVAAGGGASGWVLGGPDHRVRGMALGLRGQCANWVGCPDDCATGAARGSESGPEHPRLDLGGALTATAGLALLVYGLTSAGDARSGPAFELAAAAAGGRRPS